MTHPDPGSSRRRFLGLMGLGVAATTAGPLLAGCSEKPAGSGGAQQLDAVSDLLPTHKDLTGGVKPDIVGTRPVADGYTSYPATLVDAVSGKPGTSGKQVTAMTPAWGAAPPGIAQSAYLQAVNAELGTPVTFTIQDGVTYADKLNAMLSARDVPELLCVPGWEVEKIPRFAEAIKVLFEDLTDHLRGDAVDAYPMLASFPTGAWREAVWNERLVSVPNPTDSPFPWVLFTRKDLLDARGLAVPSNLDDLLTVAKQVTDPARKVWAFDDVFAMIQMFHRVPASKQGWRLRSDGTPEFKYETPEFRQALEVMARIYSDGLVHPDVVASRGADAKQLFAKNGAIVFKQDGMGMWQGAQAEHQKTNPTLNIQAVPVFSATGGDPLVWRADKPISYTFVRKGLGKDRVQELLRIINWCSAPLGSQEAQLRDFGVEGRHHTRSPNGPVKTDLAFKEIANQYFFISGRNPTIGPFPDTPRYVPDVLTYSNQMVRFLEKDPWDGVKLEMPAAYKANQVPTEDKFTDLLRGRRPMSDVDAIVAEWKAGGGEEARKLLADSLPKAAR
ncbi:carbohydrate ABC transporter substrate-binding protein, CUT1 family (TC 3.A.1.1.-) [Micromonospora sediminicola]|uniref:Carbohydrate ABC transporter substrate-binding protein, CUT1 family (TC 3.A.1.1.-) n=1 Tax=Micromonospora sediminicola TaxID=946078 RepID=A0A1A9BB60_9ACTN|nr:extracellular solute-binding protein [Micromonospora sediminicola]SBT66219.1 carbohydrate ABC transporter substrate-binding protein, CUT1 family (TC 3.A.1.1.-) [Micromonospora sediminicola]